jgi:hypothetical protein
MRQGVSRRDKGGKAAVSHDPKAADRCRQSLIGNPSLPAKLAYTLPAIIATQFLFGHGALQPLLPYVFPATQGRG